MCTILFVFFFKQKTAYEMRISDWSSDVCSSDLLRISPGIEAPCAPLRSSAARELPAHHHRCGDKAAPRSKPLPLSQVLRCGRRGRPTRRQGRLRPPQQKSKAAPERAYVPTPSTHSPAPCPPARPGLQRRGKS